MWAMEAGRFFRFAFRLPAYQGAMRMVAERLAHDEEQRKKAKGLEGREIVPVPAGELSKIPGLGELIEYG